MIDSGSNARPSERAFRRAPSELRANMRASTIDGTLYMVMAGLAETYFAAFVLELGHSQVAMGLVATIPLLFAALAQLFTTPLAMRSGSYRRFVVICAAFQAASLLPLALLAFIGTAPVWLVFLLVTLYWCGAICGGAPWCGWMGVMIPQRVRARFFGRRNRWLYAGVLVGIVGGGLLLSECNALDEMRAKDPTRLPWLGDLDLTLPTFGVMFLVAGLCRAVSALFLYRQTEPRNLEQTDRTIPARELLRRLGTHADGRLVVFLFLTQIALQAANPFWHPYSREQLNFSYPDYYMLLSAIFLGRMVALPAWGRFAHRFGCLRLLWVGALLCVPTSALWVAADTYWTMLLAQVACGIALAAYELGRFLMLMEIVGPDERTSLISRVTFLDAFAGVIGSVAGGMVIGARPGIEEYALLFSAASIGRLVVLPILLLVRRHSPALPPEPVLAKVVVLPSAGADTSLVPGVSEEPIETMVGAGRPIRAERRPPRSA